MALEDGSLRRGLRLQPGSLRLCLLRLVLLLLAPIPVFLGARFRIDNTLGEVPVIATQAGSQPFWVLKQAFTEVAGIGSVLAGLAVLLIWLGEQLLTAGAITIMSPKPDRSAAPKVWSSIWRSGATHLWILLRIGLSAALAASAGVGLLAFAFKKVQEYGTDAGWLGSTLLVWAPLTLTVLVLLWLASVGTVALWCRVLVVADGRRRLRRVAWHALRLLWRSPLRAGACLGASMVLAQIAGLVLLVWQMPARGESLAWALWSIYLLLHLWIWHWQRHAACLLLAEPGHASIRAGSDEPFGVFGWLLQRVRKRSVSV